jgi:hypothetical protein
MPAKVADDAAEHAGRAAPGQPDRDQAGQPVGDQQPAEQVNFLLQPELPDGQHHQRARADPHQARSQPARGEHAHRMGLLVLARAFERGHLFRAELVVVTTVHSTASSKAAPPNQKA